MLVGATHRAFIQVASELGRLERLGLVVLCVVLLCSAGLAYVECCEVGRQACVVSVLRVNEFVMLVGVMDHGLEGTLTMWTIGVSAFGGVAH